MANIGDLVARLRLDSSQFDAANKKAQQDADNTARQMERAAKRKSEAETLSARVISNAVGESSLRQVAALRGVSEATRDLRRVQQLAREGFLEGARAEQAEAGSIERLTAAKLELAAATKRQSDEEKNAANGHGFSNRMAASAVLRGGGLRADENFLTMIPGATALLQPLAVAVGAAGLTGLFIHMGEEGAEAFHKIMNSASATRDAFQATHDQATVRIDDLRLENQHIQDQIDKITGHPNNGLASALFEAKKMADSLVVSLQEDRKQLEGLLKEHEVGAFGSLLTGVAGTGKQSKDLLDDQSKLTTELRDAAVKYAAATAGISDPKSLNAATDAYVKAVHDAYQRQRDALHVEKGRLIKEQADSVQTRVVSAGAQTGLEGLGLAGTVSPKTTTETVQTIDNKNKIQNVEGREKQLADAQTIAELQAKRFRLNESLGSAKQGKELGKDANAAAEKQMKGFEDLLAKRKQTEQMSVTDEINFWEAMLAPAQRYQQNVEKINEKLGTLQQEYFRKLDEAAAKAVEAQKRAGEEAQREAERAEQLMSQWERQIDERAQSLDRLNDALRKNSSEMEAWNRMQAVGAGTLSRHDAAVQAAADHAADYATKLAQLDADQDRLNAKGMLDPDQRAKEQADIDTRRASLTGERDRTASQDQLEIFRTTALGGAIQSLQKFATAATDMSSVLESITSQTLNDFNSTLIKELTTKHYRHDKAWTGLGHEVFSNASSTALKYGEGKLMTGLGLTKNRPTGSKSDPLHVMVEGGFGPNSGLFTQTQSSGSSTVNNLLKRMGSGGGNGGDDSDGSSSSGGGSGIISSLIGAFLPGFATGGYVTAGTMAMVGENGPEPVLFGQDARVIPNHQMGSVFGGGGQGDIHVHVNAQGSSSPAMVASAARQAAMEGARQGREMAARDRAESDRRRLGGVRK